MIKEVLCIELKQTHDCHAYLRSLGHRPVDVDLVDALFGGPMLVKSNAYLRHLMEVVDDPSVWVSSLNSTQLKFQLEQRGMQSHYAEFFRGRRVGAFEIFDVDMDTAAFDELLRMGGFCGILTLLLAIRSEGCSRDRLARVHSLVDSDVLANMKRYERIEVSVDDISKIAYVLDEIGVEPSVLRMNFTSDTMTLEKVEFALDRRIDTPERLLSLAAIFGHRDIAKHVIPMCSAVDVRRVINDPDRYRWTDVQAYIYDTSSWISRLFHWF